MRIKASPEDFEVEEVPAYLPSGQGEHLFLWIEKRGHDTPFVARSLAKALGIPPAKVSYAGLKDRHAVTRQWFCIPSSAEPALSGFAEEGVAILDRARHSNKLKAGHLKANRFRVRIRQVDPVPLVEAAERLKRKGLANFYGEQRFGRKGDNAEEGKQVLLGQSEQGRFERRFLLSAYQSLLFNRALRQRLDSGTFDRALLGDVMRKADTGGLFLCFDPVGDQARVDRFEISPAGPIFGPKMFRAGGGIAQVEEALLAEEGLTLDAFKAGRGETSGARRAYRVPVPDLKIEAGQGEAWASFTLPKGSYATVLISGLAGPEYSP